MFSRFARTRTFKWAAGSAAGLSVAALTIGASTADSPRPLATPGVHLWGDNRSKLIADDAQAPAIVRAPVRVPYFDGQRLRALAVAPEFAVAALANGDVVQWTAPQNQTVVLKSKKVARLAITPVSHRAVALSQNGSVWTWSASTTAGGKAPTKVDIAEKLGWFEKIVDVQCGADHVVALTNRGRAFTGFIRTEEEGAEHHGQLGIAQFPYFEAIPRPNVLHQVKLLDAPVRQVAAGAYHTLFLTERKELWGCGSNKFGQIMLPYTFRNVKVSSPAKSQSGVAGIGAGAYVTYFKAAGADGGWFAAGDGENGQFGTGSFAQCQATPVRIRLLDSMREYDEQKQQVVPVSVAAEPAAWSVGESHVFARMDNPMRDWLAWGTGDRGQLGNNKLSRTVKPMPLANVVADYTGLGATAFVAGDRISGSFTEAK